ncbi:hypothetical protein ACILPE_02180 [Capnocytophaga canimorsus]|uniref:hypothetical protein n=1 Tax=Capnocytophaga canimorsus TaxID=28188 RepID=UPI0037D09BCE
MKSNFLNTCSILFGAFLLFSSCQPEEISLEKEFQENFEKELFVKEAKHLLEEKLKKSLGKESNMFEFSVNWDTFKFEELEDLMTANERFASVEVAFNTKLSNSNHILWYKNKEKLTAKLSLKTYENGKLKAMMLLDIGGKIENIFVVENDVVKQYKKLSKKTMNVLFGGVYSQKSESKRTQRGAEDDCEECELLDEVVVVHYVRKNRISLIDLYIGYTSMTTLEPPIDRFDYDRVHPMEETFELNDGAGGGYFFGDMEDDDEIIDQITDEKIKCLHDKLRKGNNDYVKEIFSKFEGNGADFDIVISSKDKVIGRQGTEINGITKYTRGDKTIYIEISESKAAGRSALEIARTIFHEYIHADIHRKIQTGDVSNPSDFKSVYEKYKSEREEQYQHEMMGKLYVETMRDALKKFHKEQLTEDYNKFVKNYEREPSDELYEALAWQGLKEHNVDAYKELNPDKKKSIDEVLQTEAKMLTKNCN